MRFKNKVVLITGAAGKIGTAIAHLLAAEGALLALVDVKLDAVKKLSTELKIDDERFIILKADVTKESDVKAYVVATIEKFGRIDCFFNNADIDGKKASLTDYPVEMFEAVMNVNVKGTFLGLKYVMIEMKKAGKGSIVNTVSIEGLLGGHCMVAYNTSKHAVIGLTKVAANEAAEFGIRVNVLAQGKVLPNGNNAEEPSKQKDDENEASEIRIPLRRTATPNEIAKVALFLLSDDASYVTNSIYTVDGGITVF